MKKLLVLLLVTIAFCNILATPVMPNGDGTQANPYLVQSLDNLEWICNNNTSWDKYFLQTASINASQTSTWNDNTGFSCIGDNSVRFTGNYDGANYSIENITINSENSYYKGFFGRTMDATISNLNLTNVDIIAKSEVGALIGYALRTTVNNCSSSGTINGFEYVGGLVGKMQQTDITNGLSNCIITGGKTIGGLLGYMDRGNLQNCAATGKVNLIDTPGTNFVAGGLIGETTGVCTVSKCYATGDVVSDELDTVGGFVGESSGEVTISNCYALGNVSGDRYIGGFAGNLSGNISNCYSLGSVTHVSEYNCHGFAGYALGANTVDCYFNTDTANLGDDTDDSAIEVNDIQMRNESTFANWDFVGETANGTDDIWAITPEINDGYPYFYTATTGAISDEKPQNKIPSIISNFNIGPNPFNPCTTIRFNLSKTQKVSLKIYNVKGQMVKNFYNGTLQKGNQSLTWKANNLSSGIYFVKLNADKNSFIKKAILLK